MQEEKNSTSQEEVIKHDYPEWQHGLRDSWKFVKDFFFRLTHLASDTDYVGTVKSIKSGVVLEGSNLWVLICSVMIASIGLDLDSAAVIIGAMLISPLMSPILGIGLGAAINDRETLIKSVRNFLSAILLTLVTSVIYFKITPLGLLTEQMISRTEPNLLDVLVAFFGGLAGIIAGSRTEKTNAIPGVAIATALMPPLCTSGFGLATGQWDVFAGAFYLFFINAVFISLSTYMIVRFLKFPYVEVLNPVLARRARMTAYVVLTLLLVPSVWFLFKKLTENFRHQRISTFITENINPNYDLNSVQWKVKLDSTNIYRLRVISFGAGSYINYDSLLSLEKTFNEEVRNTWQLTGFDSNDSIHIELVQSEEPADSETRVERTVMNNAKRYIEIKFREEMGTYKQKDDIITGKDREIEELKNELLYARGDTLPFETIKNELKAIYPELTQIGVARVRQTDFENDSLAFMLLVKWEGEPARNRYTRQKYEDRLKNFINVKLKDKKIGIINY
ncbi:TIGR00341 family protein [Bernardetia sp.]|uniref:TIGR00341 family protein n=1 Tax=Bernardetia sp. TaxID=1937974 RepID=UPI0025C5E5CD|nr:TIGR00341 family protein [Bernardetia sp.]